jgi:ribosomal protein S12 methylthiotransferase
MLGLLQRDGYRLSLRPEQSDFVVINTCGFLQAARQESLDTIREMVRLKQRGQIRGLIVTGCLAQRDQDALLQQCPGIDQVVGLFARDEVAVAAQRLMDGLVEQRTLFRPAPTRALSDRDRLRITPPHLAFLKISEGCDRLCTFCSIPNIRGKYVSKPVDQVVDEATQLAADGVRELILVAQDTTYYGIDSHGRPQLAELLARLEDVPGVQWIRLMYLYPMHFTDELIQRLARSRKMVPYLDLPLQHANDRVLKRMARRVTRRESESLLDRLRQQIDGLVLRTTMITGFPGESEAQFQELLDFTVQQRFERLGVFAYSLEPDTPSARLEDQLPEQLRQQRRDRLLAAQQPIAFAWGQAQVGRQWDVLIDRDIPGQAAAFVGRTYADAPEIDGVVYVTGENLAPGQIVPCEIVAAKEYDLIAVATGQPR